MNLIKTIILLVSPLILFVPKNVYSQEEMLFVDNRCFLKPQRVSSVFHHDSHNEKAEIANCDRCHHIYDKDNNKIEDESSEDMSCGCCHSDTKKAKKSSLRKVFHTACKSCHKKRKMGPVACGHCHSRKKDKQYKP